MAADLIQTLRTCSKDERRAIALELAHSGTDEAIAELIRMVNGERRRLLRWYNIDDSIAGIEALGESRSKRGLDYLKCISGHVTSADFESTPNRVIDVIKVYRTEEVQVFFPCAPDKLREYLPSKMCYPVEGLQSEELQKSGGLYQTIMQAIKRLEATVEKRVVLKSHCATS